MSRVSVVRTQHVRIATKIWRLTERITKRNNLSLLFVAIVKWMEKDVVELAHFKNII